MCYLRIEGFAEQNRGFRFLSAGSRGSSWKCLDLTGIRLNPSCGFRFARKEELSKGGPPCRQISDGIQGRRIRVGNGRTNNRDLTMESRAGAFRPDRSLMVVQSKHGRQPEKTRPILSEIGLCTQTDCPLTHPSRLVTRSLHKRGGRIQAVACDVRRRA